ncbi:MAG TPA: proliferating cell nuclear antigen (pcna) [Candidatus Nanoarchaeia archaeon]|nr:proliferating cell nuclear antigen (pcna) [Candidatus Nanoarchaeia archaeon]
MLLKLDDARFFGTLIGIISELVTEVRLKITKEGMHLVALDPANVAMVHFHIPAELFSQFSIEKDEILGINLDNLNSVMRRCSLGSSIILAREENTLRITIQDKIKRDFTLALISVEGEDRELPTWEFKSVIKMDAQTFVEVVEDCLVVSDACTFSAEQNKFVVEARGLNSARIEFSSDEVEIYSDVSSARFSLEYLSKFMKGAKIANKVEINFSDNHPMRINFPTGKVMLSFVLAPRIEQDD